MAAALREKIHQEETLQEHLNDEKHPYHFRGDWLMWCNGHIRFEWSDHFIELTNLPNRSEHQAHVRKVGKQVWGTQGPSSTHSRPFSCLLLFN